MLFVFSHSTIEIRASWIFPSNPPLDWCNIVRENLNDDLIPFVPAPNNTDPIDAAIPVLIVAIGAVIYSITSTILNPALTDPPGESICIVIGFFGSCWSKNKSCAWTIVDIWSLTVPATQRIRSIINLEKISICVARNSLSSKIYGVILLLTPDWNF